MKEKSAPLKTPETYEGVITITRRGMGFFSIGEDTEDLIIPRESLNTAFAGDVVRVARAGVLLGPQGKREAGKVLEIIERARETFVGTIAQEGNDTILAPDLKNMYVPLVLSEPNLQLGYKAVARFVGWDPKEEWPRGKIEEIIGKAGVHETEMRALVLAQGFHPGFPPDVEREAQTLEQEGRAYLKKGVAGRKDFREVTTFTIDPFDAKDFDDALSVRTLPDGNFEIGVHIADVSYFVRPGTALEREAQERATSVYLVDRTIPMLPEILSADLCSLRPNEDRLSVSAVFTLDKNAEVKNAWFGETVIHSNKRFTYEEAQEVLDRGKGPHHAELSLLRELSKKIRAARQAKGAIEFDTAEVKIDLDEEGRPIRIRLKERKETNLLIEDFMLLANESVATHLTELSEKKGLAHGFIYRVHDTPDADRIESLALFLRVLGYDLKTHAGKVRGQDLNSLLREVRGKPEEYLIKTATLRSMAKAIYTTRNVGHFGLAFTHYTHFTSPIRRYPDLLVHRLLKHHTGSGPISEKEMSAFEELAVHASEREVAAVEAERGSIKLKQVEFLSGHIGEAFDAVISGVSERGLYVEEKTTRAEGMVRVRDLKDDYYTYDEKHYRLVGTRTKKVYQLGDPIRVTLAAARIFERELDFVPAGA